MMSFMYLGIVSVNNNELTSEIRHRLREWDTDVW